MTDLLLLSFVFLVAGVFAVPVAARLGLGSVLGYLIAGILISPILALLDFDVVSLQHFAEFGVVMMLFLIGLELEPKLLWSMRFRLLGLGGGQVVLTTAAITGVSMAIGQPWALSLAIGLTLSLSSTAIVLQTLAEKNQLKTKGGQSSLSVLLLQDIAVIPMLAFIPLLAIPEIMNASIGPVPLPAHSTGPNLVENLNGVQKTMVTLAAIGAVVLGGNFLIGPIFRFVSAAKIREMFTATALMIVIGIALLMALVGLSPALGTFLAGVVLANSDYRHELETDINPFKGLLLGLFFMNVGAGINFGLLSSNLLTIIGLTLGLIAIKLAVLMLMATIFRLKGRNWWLFALGLAQAGEFGFVLLSFSVANGVIPKSIADQLLLVVALSMLLTPLLFIIFDRVIVPRLKNGHQQGADTFEETHRVIIAGQGRVGQVVARMLRSAGFAPTVIDFSTVQLSKLNKFGERAYFGDVTRPDLLRAAGIADAKLFVITITNRQKITKLVKYITKNYPDVHVICRAHDNHHSYELYAAGCKDTIRETFDCALHLGRSAFEVMGATSDQAEQMRQVFDTTDRKAVEAMAEHYDPAVPGSENDAYVAKVREASKIWQKDLREKMQAILDAG